jgi:hypothetical protein
MDSFHFFHFLIYIIFLPINSHAINPMRRINYLNSKSLNRLPLFDEFETKFEANFKISFINLFNFKFELSLLLNFLLIIFIIINKFYFTRKNENRVESNYKENRAERRRIQNYQKRNSIHNNLYEKQIEFYHFSIQRLITENNQLKIENEGLKNYCKSIIEKLNDLYNRNIVSSLLF